MDDPRYHTKRWQELRLVIIRRDGPHCAIPHCTTDMTRPMMTQVDHIIEVRDGGPFWNPSNLQVVCFTHHKAKTLTTKAQRPTRVSPNA